jgi:hypothetical protein
VAVSLGSCTTSNFNAPLIPFCCCQELAALLHASATNSLNISNNRSLAIPRKAMGSESSPTAVRSWPSVRWREALSSNVPKRPPCNRYELDQTLSEAPFIRQ